MLIEKKKKREIKERKDHTTPVVLSTISPSLSSSSILPVSLSNCSLSLFLSDLVCRESMRDNSTQMQSKRRKVATTYKPDRAIAIEKEGSGGSSTRSNNERDVGGCGGTRTGK